MERPDRAHRTKSVQEVPTHLRDAPALESQVFVLAWGDDGFGQCLGGARSSLASMVRSPSLVRLPEDGLTTSQICAGWEQSFLVSRTGDVWGGGSNRGQCLTSDDDGEQVLGMQRLDLLDSVEFRASTIDAGREHFVAVQQEGTSLLTWASSNEFGQTGQGAQQVGLGRCSPRLVELQNKVRICAVACGQDHTLALTERGEVFSWGNGTLGQLGHGSAKGVKDGGDESKPVRVEKGVLRGLPVRQIAAGCQHSMALGISGQVVAWGCNRHGRLGLGLDFDTDQNVMLPSLVSDLPPARSLSAGGRHSGAILLTGQAFLTGDNQKGQLGHDPNEVENSGGIFLAVPFEDYNFRVRAMVLGDAHTLMLTFEGELFGVGDNERGQLGVTGDSVHTLQPMKMPDEEMIIWGVASGQGHCLALASPPPASHSRFSVDHLYAKRSNSLGEHVIQAFSKSMPMPAMRSALKETKAALKEEEEDSPLERTVAYTGGAISVDTEGDALEPEQKDDEDTLARLRSTPCHSKLSYSGNLEVKLRPLAEPSLAAPRLGRVVSAEAVEVIMHSRPYVRSGVATSVGFQSLRVQELKEKVQMLSEVVSSENQQKAKRQLLKDVAAVLRSPTVLGSSFLFPGLYEARLDSSALGSQICEYRRGGSPSLEDAQSWALASATTMRLLAPDQPCGVLRNLRTKDQIRAIVVCLIIPDWPALLANYPETQSEFTTQSFECAKKLLQTVARLPVSGRMAFCDVVADECEDVAVFRDILLPAAQAIMSSALRHAAKTHRIEDPVWNGVFLLQLLWAAKEKRLQKAKEIAGAARAEKMHAEAAHKNRTFSRTLSSQSAVQLGIAHHRTLPTAALDLPLACFQLDALIDIDFPPEVELRMFAQHAKNKMIDPAQLCTEGNWEVNASGKLPQPFMSFMANGNLVPTAFKQRVLQVENILRQQQEQRRLIMDQSIMQPMGGFIQLVAPTVRPQDVYFLLEIERDDLLNSTAVALHSCAPEDLRKPLKVKFTGEEGLDAGGVAKEYFRLISLELFGIEFGMFKPDAESRIVWFDPGSTNATEDFWLAGAIVGLAVYNNMPGLNVNFPLALFKTLKGEPMTMEDFQQAFPSQAASLQVVLNWEPPRGISEREAEQEFEELFCLDFSVSYETKGKTLTVNLLSDDEAAPPPVTLATRTQFAEKFKDWYLTKGIQEQLNSFKEGFKHVCGTVGSTVFSCLSAIELESIVGGSKDLDFANLKKGASVVDSEVKFSENYLKWLWEILEDFDAFQKKQFLKFVTGSDLAPVGGLEGLKMKIQRNGGEPTQHLPTAHTCFNLLMLPEYDDREKLKRLLISAIENSEGFGLE